MSGNHQEIEELEIQLNSQPNNINNLCRLAELYFSDGRGSKATPLVHRAIEQFLKTQLTVTQGLNVFDISVRAWKTERFTNKKTMRLNVTRERKQLLEQIHQVALTLIQMRDMTKGQLISFKTAYIKESLGLLQDSLSLLSDLIAAQAIEGIDFSYIILKAAIILKHLGENKQSIEYLEYLDDDPPIESGYTKTHVLAFLILVYEQSAEKYKVFLGATYKKLIQSCIQEAEHTQSTRHHRKLMEIAQNKNLHTSSELWEILAIQALDRCEYILALEFLHQALNKSPGKATVLQWLVEVYYLLGENTKASKYGEKASVLLPQSTELRNVLIQIDPDKWTEKLRFISPTRVTATGSRDGQLSPNGKKKTGDNDFSLQSIQSHHNTASAVLGFGKKSTVATNATAKGTVAKEKKNDSSLSSASVISKDKTVEEETEHTENKVTTKEVGNKEENKDKDKDNHSTNGWFSKMTSSAAHAIQSITKDKSFSPPRFRKESNVDTTTAAVLNKSVSRSSDQMSPIIVKNDEKANNEDTNADDNNLSHSRIEESEEDTHQVEIDHRFDQYDKPSNTISNTIQADHLEFNLVQMLDQKLGFHPSTSSPLTPPSASSTKIKRNSTKMTAPNNNTNHGGDNRILSPNKSSKSNKISSSNSIKVQAVKVQTLEEEMKNIAMKDDPSRFLKIHKPKKVTEEQKKYIQLALQGNQNIHFYHPTLQALSTVSKKVELDKKRAELLK